MKQTNPQDKPLDSEINWSFFWYRVYPLPNEGVSLVPSITHKYSTITMKGPWESIATGMEKGHKTQKIEKVATHNSKRVVLDWMVVYVVARF